MKWSQFPDELDTSALQLVYDAWKGGTVDKAKLGIAAANVAGYGYGQMIGQPPQPVLMGAAPAHGTAEASKVDEAFHAAMSHHGDAKHRGLSASAVPWSLLFQIAVTIMQQLLHKA